MKGKAFIFLLLLVMSVASRAATDDFDSFMGDWGWILALSLYAVFVVILLLALCKAAAASDALEDKNYEEINRGRAPRPKRLDLNLADFGPQFLDSQI